MNQDVLKDEDFRALLRESEETMNDIEHTILHAIAEKMANKLDAEFTQMSNTPENPPLVKPSRVTIKHQPIGGYRHTLGVITFEEGKIYLVLQCVKKSCKDAHMDGTPHEVKLLITPEIYTNWREFYG